MQSLKSIQVIFKMSIFRNNLGSNSCHGKGKEFSQFLYVYAFKMFDNHKLTSILCCREGRMNCVAGFVNCH